MINLKALMALFFICILKCSFFRAIFIKFTLLGEIFSLKGVSDILFLSCNFTLLNYTMMKQIYFLTGYLILLFLFDACNFANDTTQSAVSTNLNKVSNKTLKRYNVKSGIVHYQTNIKGKVMGSTITGSGQKDLFFRNWGALELKKNTEKKITHINIFGHQKTKVDKIRSIDKLDNGKSYKVDLKNKVIYMRDDPFMSMMKNNTRTNAEKAGRNMLEAMGGRKIGTANVLGYACDVWQIPGGKQWIYKGVPLKIKMTVMGMTTEQTATSAKFNIPVADKYFVLPDYPVEKLSGYTGDIMSNHRDYKIDAKKKLKMTFKQYKQILKKNDPETFRQMTEEELKTGYNLMKQISGKMPKY